MLLRDDTKRSDKTSTWVRRRKDYIRCVYALEGQENRVDEYTPTVLRVI